jgi:hypothetical protein
MDIRVSGIPWYIDREEARDLIKWMGRELRIDRYKDPIFIDLRFRYGFEKTEKCQAEVLYEDTNYRPRMFTISVDQQLGRLKMMRSLIHEMVHVKQFASGKMFDLMRKYGHRKWCNKVINVRKIKYRELPWEKEAYELEKVYYKSYNNKKRN